MKKNAKRLVSILLTVILLLTVSGCGILMTDTRRDFGTSPVEKGSESRENAYRDVVQGIIEGYGLFDTKKIEELYAFAEEDRSGFIDAETVDADYDGEDELFCVYMEKNMIHMSLYDYTGGNMETPWHASVAWFGVLDFYVEKFGDTIYWFYGNQERFYEDMLTYRDGAYQSAASMPDTNDITFPTPAMDKMTAGIQHTQKLMARIGLLDAYGKDTTVLMAVNCRGVFNIDGAPALSEATLSRWGLLGGTQKETPQDVLGKIPYYGDKTKCVMDRKMAEAYAAALEAMPQEHDEMDTSGSIYTQRALLMDLADDGMPLLVVSYADEYTQIGGPGESLFVFTYDGEKATPYPFRDDTETGELFYYKFYPKNTNGMITMMDGMENSPGGTGFIAYKVENAQIEKIYSTMDYEAIVDSENSTRARSKCFPGVKSYQENGALYADVSDLQAAGWVAETESDGRVVRLYARARNGEMLSYADYAAFQNEMIGISDANWIKWGMAEQYEIISMTTGWNYIQGNWGYGKEVALNLRAYAEISGRPSYSFEEISETYDAEKLAALTEEVLKGHEGTRGEVFRLSTDLYYVIIYRNEEPVEGVLVKNTHGGTAWRILFREPAIKSEAELTEAVTKDEETPNIDIDMDKTGKGADYLNSVLSDIDGTTPNDAAKAAIITFIENLIAEESQTVVKAKKNHVDITGKVLEKGMKKAADSLDEIQKVLEKGGVALNKDITVTLHILCNKVDFEKPIRLTLDESTGEKMGNAREIVLLFEDTRYAVRISKETLENAIGQYGEPTILLQKTGDNTYAVQFVDKEGNPIEKIEGGITFCLPAEGEQYTVFITYGGGADNWGGTFDADIKAITFKTPYSGTYTISENIANITDIDGLSEEQQRAIRLMVSKGCFEAKDNRFNPEGTLTRYEFAQALVKIFFELDKTLACPFPDVEKENPYYPYVASGAAIRVIEGFTDGTFRGDENVTRAAVYALCGRTLHEKKGYKYPENLSAYLVFRNASEIPAWAASETALDVREGLLEKGGDLEPLSLITRAESAEILYKLYMLLYETEPIAVQETSGFPIIFGVVGALAVSAAGVWFVMSRKKKRTGTAS